MQVYVLLYSVYHSDLYEQTDDIHGMVCGAYSTFDGAKKMMEKDMDNTKRCLEILPGLHIEEDEHSIVLYSGDAVDTEYVWGIKRTELDADIAE